MNLFPSTEQQSAHILQKSGLKAYYLVLSECSNQANEYYLSTRQHRFNPKKNTKSVYE